MLLWVNQFAATLCHAEGLSTKRILDLKNTLMWQGRICFVALKKRNSIKPPAQGFGWFTAGTLKILSKKENKIRSTNLEHMAQVIYIFSTREKLKTDIRHMACEVFNACDAMLEGLSHGSQTWSHFKCVSHIDHLYLSVLINYFWVCIHEMVHNCVKPCLAFCLQSYIYP